MVLAGAARQDSTVGAGLGPALEKLWAVLPERPGGKAVGWRPDTPEQEAPMRCGARVVMVVGGEGSGKSLLTAKMLVQRHLCRPPRERPYLYWLLGHDYDACRKEWDYLIEDFTALGYLDPPRVEKKTLNGYTNQIDPGLMRLKDRTVVRTKSALHPEQIRAEEPDGVVLCEAGQNQSQEIYDKTLARTVGRTEGAWLILAGTFERGSQWYFDLYERLRGLKEGEFRAFAVPSWANLHNYPGGRRDSKLAAIEAELSEDFFLERFAAMPRAAQDRVFPEARSEWHVTAEAEYIPGQPVYVTNDPGVMGAFAVLAIQKIGGQVRVVSEVYKQNLTAPEIVEMCMSPEWAASSGNPYWWPDVARVGVIDQAGLGRQGGMPPVAEVWQARAGLTMIGSYIRVQDGEERLHQFLRRNPITGVPGVIIHPRCRGILSELGLGPNPFDGRMRYYHYRLDAEGQKSGSEALDRYNHSIKALWYWLVDHFGYAEYQKKPQPKVRWRYA